jgi:NitT/TauT family transport system substrate-binding protein
MLFLCLAFVGAAQAQTPVRFLHEWRFEGHVAPFLVARDKGYFKAEGLDASVDPGTGSLNTINQVASGNYQLGIADINSLIRYRDNAANVPIKAVMMVYDSPPFAILTLKKNNITKPKDLEGRTLGAPAADGAWAQFPILAKLNGIDMSKVRVDNVGFPVREALLAQGKVDAVTAFGSNALGLRANNISQDEIVVLMMRRFGLDLYGSAIFAHPDFMKSQPKAVAGFNREMTGGAGYIALAAVIFGKWDPIRATLAALLFGFATNLQGVLSAIGSPVPSQFMLMLPYLVTIFAVAGLVGRSRPPAADGVPYRQQ